MPRPADRRRGPERALAGRASASIAIALAIALVAACGTGAATPATPSASEANGTGSTPAGEVVVFATASLADAFGEMSTAFTTSYPDVTVTLNIAASSTLVAQIIEGAPVDVFAAADLDNMVTATDAGTIAGEPVVFTTNRAAIIVAPGNPRRIAGVADLATDDLIVIACTPAAPCGRYARMVLDAAGVSVRFASLEENVRGVVSKVVLGEADAGLVYATDVINAGEAADGVEIPPEINIVAEYPIAVTAGARQPDIARAFIDFVLSADGQAILATYGFIAP